MKRKKRSLLRNNEEKIGIRKEKVEGRELMIGNCPSLQEKLRKRKEKDKIPKRVFYQRNVPLEGTKEANIPMVRRQGNEP